MLGTLAIPFNSVSVEIVNREFVSLLRRAYFMLFNLAFYGISFADKTQFAVTCASRNIAKSLEILLSTRNLANSANVISKGNFVRIGLYAHLRVTRVKIIVL